MNFFKKLIASFDNHTHGLSARKLTAFFAVMVGAYITKYKLPQEAQLHALYAWLILALLCLGIVTAEQIIKLKNGKNEISSTDTTSE